MKFDSILQSIGNTPVVHINRLFGANTNVWIKSERSNPGGSIKDRIALAMVEDAEKSGKLQPGGTIIERPFLDDTQPGGPTQRIIQYTAPFTLADREADYRVAWAHFAKEANHGEPC